MTRGLLLRGLLLSLALHATSSLSVPTPSSRTTPPQPQQQQLSLIEHTMPLMPPHDYEPALAAAFADRGEVLRWYIARIDETAGSAIAEVVILPHQR